MLSLCYIADSESGPSRLSEGEGKLWGVCGHGCREAPLCSTGACGDLRPGPTHIHSGDHPQSRELLSEVRFQKSELSEESVNAAAARRWEGLQAGGHHKHGVERVCNEMGQNRVHQIQQRHPTKLQTELLQPTEVWFPQGGQKTGDEERKCHPRNKCFTPWGWSTGSHASSQSAQANTFQTTDVHSRGCSFGAAAILQYETLKSRVQTAKDEEEAEKLLQGSQDMAHWHEWWNQLSGFQRQLILLMSMVDDFWSSLTEGQKTVTETRCLPMVLSSFSHYSVIHMVANMYVLWTFSSGIVSLLGKEQFLAVYLSAGVISTMVSYMCKTATGRLHPSLGASGAVMAVLAAVCAKVPEAKLGIIFLPMITFTAGNALKALIAVDVAGLIMGWRLFDHAAHLGGALFGVWYVAYGHKLIWRKREPLVKLWHNMRSPGPSGSRPGGGPGVSGGPGPRV
ncbi:hypothetical protein L3Q82_006179 [Scortum barcoo]|uniref:Uncharacterized protein n=1 Tax=Scortum barcoo TaxID=214431 RepID=A0ACB8X2Z6_9TELE|nr:hypothetical protein L3Q82_006179 [Scortum barcoo]